MQLVRELCGLGKVFGFCGLKRAILRCLCTTNVELPATCWRRAPDRQTNRHTSQHHSWPSSLRTRSVWAFVDIWSYLNTCRRHCNSAWYDHPAVPFLPINNEDNYCTWHWFLFLNRTRILPHSWFVSGDKITRALVDAKLGCIYSPIYTAVSGRS